MDVQLAGADLLAFVVTVEVGSINAAADALSLTPSAVTKRVQKLERRTGVRLLERGSFGARATAAGSVMYPEARLAVDALQRTYEAVGGHRAPGRTLRMAASHTVGEFLLPGWLAVFRLVHPDLRVQVNVVNSRAVRRAVSEGAVDLGFVEDAIALENVLALPVCRDQIVVVVHSAHRWAGRTEVAPDLLRSESYVTREAGSGTRTVAEAALAEVGVRLSPTLEVASVESIKRAVAHGGFALLSRVVVDAEVRAGTLSAVAVAGVPLERVMLAIRRPATTHSDAAEFWHWLHGQVQGRTTDAATPVTDGKDESVHSRNPRELLTKERLPRRPAGLAQGGGI